ncbi:MAG: PilZ domain-containing protein, partial [Myxococcota bacterium]
MNDFLRNRRHQRVDVPTVSLKVATAEKFRRRYIRDLSQGGVYVRTQDVRPIGSEVRLELSPPGWQEPIRIRAEVVRHATVEDDGETTAVGMGLEFREVGPRNRELLAELLSEYESTAPRFDENEIPDDLADLRQEVRALRARLRESREMVASLHNEIETLEEDDETNRVIIERLARDKKQLQDEADAARAELTQQLQAKHAKNLRSILDGYERRQRKSDDRLH